MSRTHVMESRPLDFRYDSTFIGPYTNVRMDARVQQAVSNPQAVAGTTRFKYFRRPVMPRMSAIPPTVLLAPTVANTDPGVPIEDIPEPPQKSQSVQTMYRESEAQTVPYTPDYVVQEGEDPEVLMLKDLTFDNGLPLKKKDLEMIFYAKAKREMESHLPPFTDEASLMLRKRLMEQQEMREFSLREREIDRRREERLEELQNALNTREQSNELLSSQRVEAIRQNRMDEREVALQKIRNKRIKVLRRLARKRNSADPLLSERQKRDPINDYYDKASTLYAPIQRQGKTPGSDPSSYDIASRTVPLDSLDKIADLETAVPMDLRNPEATKGNMSPDKQFSKTEPLGVRPRVRASEPRLTSAAMRHNRSTKRDVEEMHRILTLKKKEQTLAIQANSRHGSRAASSAQSQSTERTGRQGTTDTARASTAGSKGPAGRPVTPDLTLDKDTGIARDAGHDLQAAVVLLQKLIRGRSVQNVMYEGRARRAELISELRSADDYFASRGDESAVDVANEVKLEREQKVKDATVDYIIGGTSSSMMALLNQEKERLDTFAELEVSSIAAEKERQNREYSEAGRRQKENFEYPTGAREGKEPEASEQKT